MKKYYPKIAGVLLGALLFPSLILPIQTGVALALEGDNAYDSTPGQGTNTSSQSSSQSTSQSTKTTSSQTIKDKATTQTGKAKINEVATSDMSTFLLDGLGCSFGQILGSMIGSAISALLNRLLGDLISNVLDVRITVRSSNSTTKEYASFELFGFILLPSLDSIAYCVANALITYIADSTIAWIRSGFKDSPAFVEDPGRALTELADEQFEEFLDSTLEGFFCDNWVDDLKEALTNSYNSSYGDSYLKVNACTLADSVENYEEWLAGKDPDPKEFWSNWRKWNKSSGNNPYKSLEIAKNSFSIIYENKKTNKVMTWNWGRGFVSFEDDEGNIYSPGSVIEDQLSKTLGLSKERLVLAEKFDQVIAELVNELIKVALDETLKATGSH